MAYVALYRKYRPQNLQEVVGQQAIKQALTNAFEQERIVHAYLFSGPRGTGKTSIAKIFAKTINCSMKENVAVACNECSNCVDINNGNSMDVFEIDAASNRGIDQIRDLRENVKYSPSSCKYKVYIIDEAHMLTGEAFNALLKTLEEPPAHVVFILATTEAHKIPITIQSRCQRYDFRKLSLPDLEGRISFVAKDSNIEIEKNAVSMIALQADGALRDALSLLEQASIVQHPITEDTLRLMLGNLHIEDLREFVRLIAQWNMPQSLILLNRLLEQGKEVGVIFQELLGYLRAMIIFKVAPTEASLQLTDTKEALADLAGLYTDSRLLELVDILGGALQEIRFAVKPVLSAELAVMKICRKVSLVEKVMIPNKELQVVAEKHVSRVLPEGNVEVKRNLKEVVVDKKNILQLLVEQLNKDSKRTVSACLSPGFATVHSCSQEHLTLVINKKFALSRICEEDYMGIIEQTLQKIYGQKIRFLAIDEAQASVEQVGTSVEELVPVDAETVQNLSNSVQQAHKMFGGTVNIVK